MDKQSNKVISLYLKEIASALICPKSLKSVFLSELRGDIETYTTSVSTVTEDDLYKEFGTPDEISNGFLDRNNYDDLLKKAKRKAFIWKLICIGVSILLIFFICLAMSLLDMNGDTINVSDAYVS